MAFTYTRAKFTSDINRHIQNKQGLLIDINETANEAVRTVYSEIDLRSARRKIPLAPNLFNQEFDYACPSDLKAYGIIDIPQQAKRSDGEFNLIPSREFATNHRYGDIAIDDYNGQRILKIASRVSDTTVVFSELDSLTSNGGTWVAKGDMTSLAADTDDYIKGNGSIKCNINASGGTTAGIQNTNLDTLNFTPYIGGNGAVFVWVKINSTTGLTSYSLEIGTNTSNYYKKTVTTQNDGTPFSTGWNLLRFDMTSLFTTGTPTITTFNYAAIYMTKLGSKISESDYKFDYLVCKVGKNADIKYYTKFGWQDANGAYIENSSAATDVLVCDTDEYDLLVKYGKLVAAQEADLPEAKIQENENRYDKAKKNYMLQNPSEATIMTSEYYNYGNDNDVNSDNFGII